jgi:hypothetical protein
MTLNWILDLSPPFPISSSQVNNIIYTQILTQWISLLFTLSLIFVWILLVDGKPHQVQLYYDNSGEICVNTADQKIVWTRYNDVGGNYNLMSMGTSSQNILARVCSFSKHSRHSSCMTHFSLTLNRPLSSLLCFPVRWLDWNRLGIFLHRNSKSEWPFINHYWCWPSTITIHQYRVRNLKIIFLSVFWYPNKTFRTYDILLAILRFFFEWSVLTGNDSTDMPRPANDGWPVLAWAWNLR